MTTMTKYTTPGSHNLHVPTRTEFHRYYSNNLDVGDFCTGGSNGIQVSKVANAINMTLKNKYNKKLLTARNKNSENN